MIPTTAPSQGFLATSVSSAAFPLLAPNGTAAAPSYSSSVDPKGMWFPGTNILELAVADTGIIRIDGADGIHLRADFPVLFKDSTGGTTYTSLVATAAVLALKNSTTAQEWQVWGTTTGSKYVSLKHDGTNGILTSSAGDIVLTPNSGLVSFGNGLAFRNNTAGGNFYVDVGVFHVRDGNGTSTGWDISGAAGGLTAQSNSRFSHGTSALATTATEGFLHIQSCAGTPTGVPASIPSGQIPMVYDSTNNKLFLYTGGAWKKGQVAAVDVIWA